METRARIAGHPIHPMLIPFPIGLWVFSLAADIAARVSGDAAWLGIAYWTMLGGTVGALLAAIPGLIDYFALTEARAVRIATIHLTLNVAIVGLFIANLVLRSMGRGGMATLPIVLSAVGVGLLLVSGWFGWELIYREGVAVEPEIRLRKAAHKGAA
ncbi:MAG TPA: DUF2231 domain-containing protein [Candidatus Binatia bacterium]|jgi:uncharacterized membrane protein|nr:DUF2231 domain-containing protein [Candidatus Binatia bacterium]